ncbi:MAG: 4Fe-4S dicluster domain-containing protein, partial [Gemmatimonadales bacterium]
MGDHDDDFSRRSFLKALGASLALAGLDGCTRMPAEKILPFVHQPPEFTPGVPVHYATSMLIDGYATGLVVEAHEGRPTKIEGNPEHPASLGAAGVFEQASLLQLYDPHRAASVRAGRRWPRVAAAMRPDKLRPRVGARGAGLALLLEPTSSPLVKDLFDRLRALYPAIGIHYYAPLTGSTGMVIPQYDFHAADVILALDANFLAAGPFHLRYARDFADRRRDPREGMNRLYAAEPGYSVTGAAADHRVRCRALELEPLLTALLALIEPASGQAVAAEIDLPAGWLDAVAEDLRAHAGAGLVIAGDRLSPRAQALAAAINDALGNTGRTVWHTRSPLLGAGDETATLESLAAALGSGTVDTLICLGGNPSYATPATMQFSQLMGKVRQSIYLGLYENETSRDATWSVPAAHYLESWGDGCAYDGTRSIVQPLVRPLHGGKSVIEMLGALIGDAAADPLALLRDSWRRAGAAADDAAWQASLRRGLLPGSAAPKVPAPARTVQVGTPLAPAVSTGGQIEVVFGPDARVHDGSFSNNPWLQELPDPVTKLTWDNAGLLSPATARRLGVDSGDVISLRRAGAELRIPALIVPGHADDSVSLQFGYGRTGAEATARAVGVDVYAFWPALGAYVAAGVSVTRVADAARHELAITQTHWTMEGRDQARSQTVEAYRSGGAPHTSPPRRQLTIYDPPPRPAAPHQWAMTIDLGACTGCSACVVACQAENNIPVVGRDDVLKSREMHWIRLDRYLVGDEEDPEIVTQPMLCQHCENAPCEYVCPVGATDHSDEGLNEMIYNRCVGTRYCSNNCPYKVRRFNWF